MADEFVYIVQDTKGSYIARYQESIEAYLKDIELTDELGYKIIKSFRVPSETLSIEVLEKCLDFENKRISLSELEEKIQLLIKPSK